MCSFMCVCVQMQALPSTVSVCPHLSVAPALKMASCDSGPLISQMCSWKQVSAAQWECDIIFDC